MMMVHLGILGWQQAFTAVGLSPTTEQVSPDFHLVHPLSRLFVFLFFAAGCVIKLVMYQVYHTVETACRHFRRAPTLRCNT